MSNAAKYIVVIGFLVLLGGVGVYGMGALQNSSTSAVSTLVVKTTAKPVASATANPATTQSSADLDTQNASFTSEGSDSGSSIESANPSPDLTPTDTSTTDTVLANE